MLISQNELSKHGIVLDIDTLEKGLVQLGHEVEGYEDYANDKLVVGHVLTCVKHPEADKLNITTVDVGTEVLQIVCGAPNVGVGQDVIVAVKGCMIGDFKIKNAKLRGVDSCGMLCSLAEVGLSDKVLTEADKDGIFNFSTPVTPGTNAMEALGLSDKVLDVSLTANRGDCLSYVGVVRDLSALVDSKLAISNNVIESTIDNPVNVSFNDENSKVLSTLAIDNVTVTSSPDWLKLWLAKHEIKTQNVIVDLANYVMFELGLPIHTYDKATVNGDISVQVISDAHKGDSFKALDGNEYPYSDDALVIVDQDKVISLASVMGSETTKITDNTTSILMEIGVFDPILVRRTAAKMLARKTDASIRGEKNVDHMQLDNAYSLYVNLLKEIQPEIIVSKINRVEQPVAGNTLTLKFNDVSKVLGIDITQAKVCRILNNLHFETIDADSEQITVSIPTWRFDINNDHDLIEEVIRVYNIDNVMVDGYMSSFITAEKVIKNKKVKIERFLEKEMLKLGLNQVVSYSLVSEAEVLEFNGDLAHAVELMMPLSNNHRYYRQSLVPSLMEIAKYNFDRQQKTANIFEIGNTYVLDGEEIVEQYYLSGLVSGIKNQNQDTGIVNYDFYDLKYIVEEILKVVNIDFTVVPTTNEIEELNKYAHADIIVDGEVIGFIAAKHPNYYKKIKTPVFVFEINLAMIEDKMNHMINYKMVSNNPIVERDLTILAPLETKYADVIAVFNDVQYIANVECSYIYSGENIKNGMKAVTFKLSFADDVNTLEGAQVDASIETIIKNIEVAGLEFKNE